MLHAEEGTLHSYLDGELTPAEVVELERHLSVCAPCRARLTEAKSFLGVADELIIELDTVPAGARPPIAAPKGRRPWPVRPAALAWAASVVLAAGIGYAWREEPTATPVMAALSQPPAPASESSEHAPPSDPRPAPRRDERVAARPREVERQDATGDVAREAPAPVPLAAAEEVAPAPPAAAAGAPATTGLASKSGEVARSNGNIAFVDGVPVDTTIDAMRTRLAFGPATTAEPKRITLDQAVDLLGGSIQLIDGLTPQRVEVLAGVDVTGADPDRQVIRIYYEEPDLGLVTLDQQRPGPSFGARRAEESPTAMPQVSVAPATPPTPGVFRRDLAALNTLSWRADGVWLSLTTRLPAERAAQLQARVK